jgi:hypothetical protein
MATRKQYSTAVAALVDAEIAAGKAAREQAGRAKPAAPAGYVGVAVGEQVSVTVVSALWSAVRRRVANVAAVVALLPLIALGLGELVRAFGQPDFATAPAVVALLVLAVFLPWRAWQVFRIARGRPLALLPLPWIRIHVLHDVTYNRRRQQAWYEIPSFAWEAEPLFGGIAAVPALLILTLVPSVPGVVVGGLVALPIVLTIVWEGLAMTLSGLGAVQGVESRATPALAGTPTASTASLAQLDERLVRLTQIRDWLRDDRLQGMVDDVIGQQVRASERRQVWYSVAIGIASLVAGWLLSAISPISIGGFLHR